MSDNMVNTETDATGASAEGQIQSQVDGKTFTQTELNEIVAKRVTQLKSRYEGIDPEEYKTLKSLKEQVEEEQLIKKQDFDGVLKKHREKADAEVSRLRAELEKIKIDGALINASSKARAVSPDHVAQLLRNQLKLDETGQVVVLDTDGKPMYTDSAEPMSVDALVEGFLASNQYFKAAGPSGTGSQGNTREASTQSVDLRNLDMNLAEHREIYKKLRMQGKL